MPHKKKYDVSTTFLNYDLHGAAAAGNLGLVMYAITHGQPINACLGGLLPIHAAASGGSVEVVQLLIEHGADVNIPRLPSATGPPINVGGAGHLVGPSGILGPDGQPINSGGEKLHKNRTGSAVGNTAPPPSASNHRPSSANNASSMPVGRRGSTPLHFAAAMGHMGVIKLLLENGANPSARDVEKLTPEMLARTLEKRAVADFLRDWELNGGAGSSRRSLETPQSASTPVGLRADPEFGIATGNHSTSSLPLSTGAPATQSTSSLGRYVGQPARRPSLPSINESPPTTSYPRPGSKKQTRSVERPATASTTTALSKLPFSIRRPKSAGNRDGQSAPVDDAASQISHTSGKDYSSHSGHGPTIRLHRIFKRPNLRPATASGALSTSPSPTAHSPPVVTRSRSPSASKASDKDRSGGFFHGHHLPHLPHLPHLSRRDQHLHPHHISRDAISGPIPNGQSPSTSIPDMARPDLADAGSYVNVPFEGRESPPYETLDHSQDDLRTEEEMYKALNLSQAEIQYAMSRGVHPERNRASSRTAPAGQTTFGPRKKGSLGAIKHYPSYSALSAKPSPTMTPSQGMVPRHRAHLGPSGNLAMTATNPNASYEDVGASRAQSPLSIGSSTVEQPSHIARPIPSFNSLNQVNAAEGKVVHDSLSSSETNLTGTSGSNDILRSPEDPVLEHPTRPAAISTTHSPAFSPMIHSAATGSTSPSVSSAGYASMSDPFSPGTVSSPMSYIDGRTIYSRAQAVELVEAQKRAIQAEHKERVKARKLASGSSHRNYSSPMREATKASSQTAIVDVPERKTRSSSMPNGESEDSDVSMDEGEVADFREMLAALGETAQMERRFAKGEEQLRKWNRESALEDGSVEDASGTDLDRTAGPASIGPSMLARTEMLEGYLRQGTPVEKEVVKRPTTPKRDVFGRPVTPKREGRPPTPKESKENRPTTPKLPTPSRSVDAPRENRVLPPPSKTPTRATQHLTLQQTRAISKSDLALGSYVNKDDLQGRERAWTTTDVRPRLGPATTSRPSTAGAKPSENPGNGGLTIDIIQTMPTPTDGASTPLRKASPMTPTTSNPSQPPETIQSRRRCASNPLRIDAKAAQEEDDQEAMPADGSKPSSNGETSFPEQQHASRPSRSRKPSTPTRSKQEPILLHRITPPAAPPVISLVPPDENPVSSFRSVSTTQDVPDSPIPSAPVPALPSAVDLHNMHMQRAKEEARKLLDSPVSPAVSNETGHSAGGWRNSPPYATVHGRPSTGVPGRNEFGYDSVRSFNEEKGGEKSWMLRQGDSIDSELPAMGKSKSKLGGLFSRLKR